MRVERQPFFHLYRYSDSSTPVPRLVPPQAVHFSLHYEGLHTFLGRIQGRTNHAAPQNTPVEGIGVASHWLCVTRPVGLIRSLTGSQAYSKIEVQ